MAKPDEAPDQLQITTAQADLARLYAWLDDASARHNLPPSLLEAMHFALEEAVMNVAMHAILPADAPEILISFTAKGDVAELLIEDAGQEFNSVTAPEKPRPKSLAEAEPGGMGLKLMRRYCKDISYQRTGGRNLLTLRFPILCCE
jgi:anti-sigma regulatory factor (Ser/Thr protein kinase)